MGPSQLEPCQTSPSAFQMEPNLAHVKGLDYSQSQAASLKQ